MSLVSVTDKRAAIVQLVKGKSFIDIGGLWGTTNEMVSVAMKGGATHAAMMDIFPSDAPAWSNFTERLAQEGVNDCKFIVDNASEPGLKERIGQFDVVHSAGVIYHLHNPLDYIINLRDVARDFVFLSSMTVPNIMVLGDESLDLSGGHLLPAFGLNARQKRILDAHFQTLGLEQFQITDASQHSLTSDGKPNFGPWWWFFTAESLSRLIGAAGLKILAVGESWPGRAHTFLCVRAQAGEPRFVNELLGLDRVAPVLTRKKNANQDAAAAAKELVEIALNSASLDVAKWGAGIDNEIQFWTNQVKEKGGRWKDSFAARITPDSPIDARMESLIAAQQAATVSILDVGAGPMTSLGTKSAHAELNIRAVDPLASLYSGILTAAEIKPPVATEYAPAEALICWAPASSFDIIHCRNALDHSLNPFLGILNMLALVKPSGAIYLRHHANEAERARYLDFHQFNFQESANRFVIWNRERAVDIAEWLAGFAEVNTWPGGLGAEVVIRPLKDASLIFDSVGVATVESILKEVQARVSGTAGPALARRTSSIQIKREPRLRSRRR